MISRSFDGLTTAPNFRDAGGWATRDGRRVRTGLIFRSEALLSPNEADIAVLRAKGIVLVCDLRSDSERTHGPNRFWEASGVERIDLDLLAKIPEDRGPWRILRERPDVDGAYAAMQAVYAAMPVAAAAHVTTIFARIAAGDLPILLHCTAGKDRTGFVSAVLLLALGVSRDDVVRDYLKSQGRWTDRAMEATRVMVQAYTRTVLDVAALEAMMGVSEDYLDAGMAAIDAEFGGLESYLSAVGVDAATLERVRCRLLS